MPKHPRDTRLASIKVRSSGLSANVLGGHFVRITSGAPLAPDVIACVERASNHPFRCSLVELRRFYRLPLEAKLAHIARAAA